jgi:hypothetical protein
MNDVVDAFLLDEAPDEQQLPIWFRVTAELEFLGIDPAIGSQDPPRRGHGAQVRGHIFACGDHEIGSAQFRRQILGLAVNIVSMADERYRSTNEASRYDGVRRGTASEVRMKVGASVPARDRGYFQGVPQKRSDGQHFLPPHEPGGANRAWFRVTHRGRSRSNRDVWQSMRTSGQLSVSLLPGVDLGSEDDGYDGVASSLHGAYFIANERFGEDGKIGENVCDVHFEFRNGN